MLAEHAATADCHDGAGYAACEFEEEAVVPNRARAAARPAARPDGGA